MSAVTQSVAGLPRPSGGPSLGQKVSDAIVMTWRQLLQTIRVPDLLVFATIQPIMFVLLFAYVFGGAIPTSRGAIGNTSSPGFSCRRSHSRP